MPRLCEFPFSRLTSFEFPQLWLPRQIAGDQRHAASVSSETNVGDGFVCGIEYIDVALLKFFKGAVVARRKGQDMQRTVMLDCKPVAGGRFFDDDMGVGAAEAEGTDAGEALLFAASPCVSASRGNFDMQAAQSMCGFIFWKCRCPRNLAVLQRQDDFDQSATPAAASRWPRLVLTEPTTRDFSRERAPRAAKDFSEGVSFDGIAEFGAGAVGFDVIDFGGRDARLFRAPRESRFPALCRWAR